MDGQVKSAAMTKTVVFVIEAMEKERIMLDRRNGFGLLLHRLEKLVWPFAIVLTIALAIAAVVVAFMDAGGFETQDDRNAVTWLLGILAIGSLLIGFAVAFALRALLPPLE
jgi:hypothetical protein